MTVHSSGALAPSPRIQHFDGEVPPSLSPLDAIAVQGRLLAKELSESRNGNRRLSRLPPSSVVRSLSQPRTGYFRTLSTGRSGGKSVGVTRWNHGNALEVEEPEFRPQSQHPRLSGPPDGSQDNDGDGDSNSLRNSNSRPRQHDEFGLPREESPDELSSLVHERGVSSETKHPSAGIGGTGLRRDSSGDSSARPNVKSTLTPPTPSQLRSNNSPGFAPTESSDDDHYADSNTGSTFSKPRKLSSSSCMSMPHSPRSCLARPPPRSPSPGSETSNTGAHLQRPAFNFSRPLSKSSISLSTPIAVIHPPGPSIVSPTRGMNRENRPAPINLPEPTGSSAAGGGPPSVSQSYIYSKYSLPRGRMVSRNSMVFSGLQTPHFEWQEPLFPSSPAPSVAFTDRLARTPSPPSSPRAESFTSPLYAHRASPARTSPAMSLRQPDQSALIPLRHSFDYQARETLSIRRSPTDPNQDSLDDARTSSTESASTFRPQTAHDGVKAPHHLSPEEHVSKGIECHEQGSLKESTYHLRLAAMQNHPTGMLLYALACRHGWGMRPNQREGVEWLRKAVDSVSLDVADDSDPSSQPRGRDLLAQKARQAQFALGIYELGVSHLNGWGIEQDKALALRCFEIAGHWGDADALAEAGYCYAEGVGCKKDLKKAAKFYRMAESKGMSMVGNSWIYKEKYISDDDTVTTTANPGSTTSEKKPRNKSRTRSIFGRKKSGISQTRNEF